MNSRARRFWIGTAVACVALFAIAAPISTALAGGTDVYVRGHISQNGTYVMPHMRSANDGNFWNNWSTRGNVNPYTGKAGTRSYPSYRSNVTPSWNSWSPKPRTNYYQPTTPSYYVPRRTTYSSPVYQTYSYPTLPSTSLDDEDEESDDE